MDLDRLRRILEGHGDHPDPDDLAATVAYLHDLGLDDDDIEAAAEGDYFFSAGLTRVLLPGTRSLRDLVAESGAPLDQIAETFRLLGIPVDDIDAPILTAEEVGLLEGLIGATDAFEGGEADEILRVTSAGIQSIAESIISVFVGGVEDRLEQEADVSWLDRTRFTQATGEQVELYGHVLANVFRHHLRHAIERQRASMSRSRDRRLRSMAIGFVDLVGFTPLSASMSSEELVAFIRDFESRSYDVASRAGGRIVKIIGDEVMVAALDASTAVGIVLELLDEFRTADTAPRAGLAAGEVVARLGDYFGSVVNLASRLADHAVPGEILAAADVGDLVDTAGLRVEPAGRRMLKGFVDPVATVSISR